MDLSSFNARETADDAIFLPLADPTTGQPLAEGDDAPGFLIVGIQGRTAQKKLAAARKAQKGATVEGIHDIHATMVASAMCYIDAARNIEWNGEKVDTPAQIKTFLDVSTFPKMTDEGKLDDGYRTFAHQVLEAAQDQDRFFKSAAAN